MSFNGPADRALRCIAAAAYLGLSENTLANMRHLGGGPAYQKGPGRRGAVRYPVSALEQWRSEHMRVSTSDAASGVIKGGGNGE